MINDGKRATQTAYSEGKATEQYKTITQKSPFIDDNQKTEFSKLFDKLERGKKLRVFDNCFNCDDENILFNGLCKNCFIANEIKQRLNGEVKK